MHGISWIRYLLWCICQLYFLVFFMIKRALFVHGDNLGMITL
jgi:hypothetical protein